MEFSKSKFPEEIVTPDESLYFIDEEFLQNRIERSGNVYTLEEIFEIRKSFADNLAQREKEYKFVEKVEENLKEKNIIIKKEDIISFHIEVKSNLITLLAGSLGSGKTSLINSYAKTLEVDEIFNFGYKDFNVKTKAFSENFIKYLEKAEKTSENKMYIVKISSVEELHYKEILEVFLNFFRISSCFLTLISLSSKNLFIISSIKIPLYF